MNILAWGYLIWMACEHLICIIICFILQKGGLFYKRDVDFTWRVSDFEELSGGLIKKTKY